MSAAIDYSIRQAEKHNKRGDINSAKAVIERAIQKYPDNPRLQSVAKRLTAKFTSPSEEWQTLSPETFQECEHLFQTEQWLLLIKKCSEIIDDNEDIPQVWNFLGIAQRFAGFPLLAEISHRRAVDIDPSFCAGFSNLGNLLKELKKFSEAEDAHMKALKIEPKNPRLMNNLGLLYEEIGRFDEAAEILQKSVEIDPEYATAEYNLSTINLRKQNFSIGWKQRQCRWTRIGCEEPYLEINKPEWTGNKTGHLFVWAEQGVGDEVMFASCFPELLNFCDKLTVSVGTRLLPLFTRSLPKEINIIERSSTAPDIGCDCHAPASTALGHLRQKIEDFEVGTKPWLVPDQRKVEILRSELLKYSDGKKIVGLSWHTKSNQNGAKRSLPLIDIAKNLDDNLFLVNLQYGDVANEVSALPQQLGKGIASFGNVDNWSDLDSFVALIDACDTVVSIDNSTVHFAGAIGKECHVLLPFSAEWRWGENNACKSYWYESLHLHWQKDLDDWSLPLSSIKTSI